jgi:hypothetical protein
VKTEFSKKKGRITLYLMASELCIYVVIGNAETSISVKRLEIIIIINGNVQCSTICTGEVRLKERLPSS